MTTLADFDSSGADNLETVLDWVRWGSSQFTAAGLYFGHGTDNSWDEALFLLAFAINQPWDMFDKIQTARLTRPEKEQAYALFRRRIEERVPAPYLTGVAWFAGLPYKVTPDVLVPRSPLAELILKNLDPWLDKVPESILDMCCGSGCIGIACAHQFSESRVDLCDISEKALEVAEQNVTFHQMDDRISVVQSDGFQALAGKTYDLIVSNPPYVDAEDFATMPLEFQAEPKLGLVSGDDGLEFTRRFLHEAGRYLNEGGLLVCEVGNSWEALENAFPQVAFTWPDLEFGGHGVFVLNKAQLDKIVS